MSGLRFEHCGIGRWDIVAGKRIVGRLLRRPAQAPRYIWRLHVPRGINDEHGGAGTAREARRAAQEAWDLFARAVGLIPIDGRRVRHKARGSTCRVVGQATAQCAEPIRDGDPVTVYVGDDGGQWVRPPAEFGDGRFEDLP